MLETTLIVRGSFEGQHYWSNAPQCYAQLRELHKHTFGFEVAIEIYRDRQVEFLDLRDAISSYMKHYLWTHAGSSCEHLATELLRILLDEAWTLKDGRHEAFAVQYAEVNEDGGCGAIVCSYEED